MHSKACSNILLQSCSHLAHIWNNKARENSTLQQKQRQLCFNQKKYMQPEIRTYSHTVLCESLPFKRIAEKSIEIANKDMNILMIHISAGFFFCCMKHLYLT